MKNQEVVKKGAKIIGKFGVKDSNGKIIVPIEYDFVEQVNDDLYVATKGSINGLRYTTGRITCTTEKGGTYGVVFDRMLESKTLDTEVEIYIKEKKLHLDQKVIAVFVCKNDDMLLIVDEDYKWSMILIDYINQIILDGAYLDVDSIEMDYESNRFIIGLDSRYVIVSFKEDNRINETTPILPGKSVELCENGAIVKWEDKYGFVNYSGKVIVPNLYKEIHPEDTFIRAINKNHVDLFLYTGEYIIAGEDYIWWKSYTAKSVRLTVFERKDGNCCIWSSNKQLIECEYTSIEVLEEFAIVCKDGKYGLLRYDKEADEMVAVFPENFPNEGYDRMTFDFTKAATYIVAEKSSFPINKVYRYNLVAFQE